MNPWGQSKARETPNKLAAGTKPDEKKTTCPGVQSNRYSDKKLQMAARLNQ